MNRLVYKVREDRGVSFLFSAIPLIPSNWLQLLNRTELLDIVFFFVGWGVPSGMRDLSSLTRNRARAPCIGSLSLILKIFVFIYLAAPGLCCSTSNLSCGM